MAKAKPKQPTKAEVTEAIAEIKKEEVKVAQVAAGEAAVTIEWLPIIKLYTVQATAVLSALAGAYAATPALQDMISPTQFASFMAVANALVIVLRTIGQGSTETK